VLSYPNVKGCGPRQAQVSTAHKEHSMQDEHMQQQAISTACMLSAACMNSTRNTALEQHGRYTAQHAHAAQQLC
jgi:hypothetical protein